MLLILLPFSGMSALPCLVGATAIAGAAVIWFERRRNRRLGAEPGPTPADTADAAAPARQIGPLAAAGLTLVVVLVVVYVIFVAASSR